MQSDLVMVCRRARALIDVPAMPLPAIRNGAESRSATNSGKRRNPIIASLLAGFSIVAVATGAEVLNGTHLWMSESGNLNMVAPEIHFKKNPTPADLGSAARQADFSVTLPAGLPQNVPPGMLMRAGSSALLLQYNLPGGWRRANHIQMVILAKPGSLSQSGPDK